MSEPALLQPTEADLRAQMAEALAARKDGEPVSQVENGPIASS